MEIDNEEMGITKTQAALDKLDGIKRDIQKMTGYMFSGSGTLPRSTGAELAKSKGVLLKTNQQLLPIVESYYGMRAPTSITMEKVRKEQGQAYMQVWDSYLTQKKICDAAALDFQGKSKIRTSPRKGKRSRTSSGSNRNRRLAANRRGLRRI